MVDLDKVSSLIFCLFAKKSDLFFPLKFCQSKILLQCNTIIENGPTKKFQLFCGLDPFHKQAINVAILGTHEMITGLSDAFKDGRAMQLKAWFYPYCGIFSASSRAECRFVSEN